MRMTQELQRTYAPTYEGVWSTDGNGTVVAVVSGAELALASESITKKKRVSEKGRS